MQRRVLTAIPAGLSLLRLVLAPWLTWLARRGARRRWCVVVATLVAIDLADGILARRIGDPAGLRRQRRLDGLADAALFAVAPVCVRRLRPAFFRQERLPLALLAGAQLASLATCYAKFGRLPRYHSEAFRWSAGVLGVALAGRVAGGHLARPFRPALAALALAHLEALAITLLLDRYRQPVRSASAVLAERRLRRAPADRSRIGRRAPARDGGAVLRVVPRPAAIPAPARAERPARGTRGLGRADLHLHTTASDGLIAPEALLEAAMALGLDVIAVTDHDTVEGARSVRELAARRNCPLEVIVGIEVTTTWGVHVLGLFVEEAPPMYQPLEATIAAITAQGGLCLVPHPLSPLTPSLGRRTIDRLLGAGYPLVGLETVNPTPAGRVSRPRVMACNAAWRLSEFGGSDAHFLPRIGSAYTSFPGTTAADVRTALVDGTTAGHEGPGPNRRLPPTEYARQLGRSMVRSPFRKLRRALQAEAATTRASGC